VILVDNRNTSDPYINLAIEEFLIRHADCKDKEYLLFYINEPSIVVGKNQSIYKEINFEYLHNGKLKLCRRISGGGTVYHDKGNLCFAFISEFADHKINNYKLFNQPVVDALKAVGADMEMDTRNNILCGGKKLSGSAQFTNRKNIISHGTILFDADLNTLRSCLKDNAFKIETKAVASVKSPVINLREVTQRFSSIEELKTFLSGQLSDSVDTYAFNHEEWNAIEKLAEEKFKSFEWIYGRSPLTRITKDEIEIEIENGKITAADSMLFPLQHMVGINYEPDEIKKALENDSNASEILKRMF
jgi:lipoate---protein ligase